MGNQTYWFVGATDRNRTCNILITNQVLYLLSYEGVLWCGRESNRSAQGVSNLCSTY